MGNTVNRIIVVEDEAVVALDIEGRLKCLGYEVAAIASAKAEALKTAEETRPDIVLMDINLNGRPEGIGAAAELRERFNIPSIFVTAHTDDETLGQAKLTGPMGYIVKPFSDRELHAAIEVGLYRHKMETALQESRNDLEQRVRELTALNYLFRSELTSRLRAEASSNGSRSVLQDFLVRLRRLADEMDAELHSNESVASASLVPVPPAGRG